MFGVRWEAANGKPGYADLCLRLMDAAYPIVPNALFFVEGTGQYAPCCDGLAFNYGEPQLSRPCSTMHVGVVCIQLLTHAGISLTCNVMVLAGLSPWLAVNDHKLSTKAFHHVI